jgi:hypothetical protein
MYYEDMTDAERSSLKATIGAQLAALADIKGKGIEASFGLRSPEPVVILGRVIDFAPYKREAASLSDNGQLMVEFLNPGDHSRRCLVFATSVYVNGEALVSRWPPFKKRRGPFG